MPTNVTGEKKEEKKKKVIDIITEQHFLAKYNTGNYIILFGIIPIPTQ